MKHLLTNIHQSHLVLFTKSNIAVYLLFFSKKTQTQTKSLNQPTNQQQQQTAKEQSPEEKQMTDLLLTIRTGKNEDEEIAISSLKPVAYA